MSDEASNNMQVEPSAPVAEKPVAQENGTVGTEEPKETTPVVSEPTTTTAAAEVESSPTPQPNGEQQEASAPATVEAKETPAAEENHTDGPPPLENPETSEVVNGEEAANQGEAPDLKESNVAKALAFLLKQKFAADWFGIPVDPVALNIPTYFDVIKKPMDLGLVSKNIENRVYKSEQEAVDDVKLVFGNATTFNPPDNIVYKTAQKLLKQFENKYHALSNPKKRAAETPKTKRTPVKKVKPNPQPQALPPAALAQVPEEELPITINQEECQRILTSLMEHDCAGPFLEPVDPIALEIPDYFSRIKYPMDLGTVKAKLDSRKYRQNKQFAADVRQIWANCIMFNGPDKGVSRMARQLSLKFEKLFQRGGLHQE